MNKNEFVKFMNESSKTPPHFDELILNREKTLMRREKIISVLSFFGVHAIAGVATLSVCPQFGWNPFGANPQTMHLFMEYGMWACGLFCGTLFMMTGSLLSVLLLSKIKSALFYKKYMQNSLALSSIFFFLLMTAGMLSSSDNIFLGLSFSLFWYIGAVLSEMAGKLFLEIKKALV